MSSPSAGSPPSGPQAPADVVATAARAFERDRYLAALLSPRGVREDLLALAAFAGELARIPAFVSEPLVGEIRLQWWRDAIRGGLEDGGEDGGGHPIAVALIAAARRHRLPLSEILDVIEAQSVRLEDAPFATFEVMRANARAWDGGLFVLAWRIIAGERASEPTPPDMLAEAGAVYGVSRMLAEVPVELTQGRLLLPADTCRRHGATPDVALEPPALKALQNAREEVVALATPIALDVARRYQVASVEVRTAALPLALVQPYLGLSRRREIASAVTRDVSPLKRIWRIWLTHRLGRIAG